MSDILLLFEAGAAELAEQIGPLPGGLTISCAATAAEALAQAADTRALLAMPYLLTRELMEAMPRLEWIQALTSGIDALAPLGIDPAIPVTTARGIHGAQISELIFLYMLAFTRDLRGILARQQARSWAPQPQRMLAGKRLVVVGVGAIGEALAARAQAFGMRVTGVSASRDAAPGFDAIVPMARLREAATSADFLLVLTPLSPATTGIVDARVIAALPRTAVLINVARGGVVDESALTAALAEGRIAGAGLDVFATEPLPRSSPLWAMPNAILTPHVAGWSDIFLQQLAPLVSDNIACWFDSPRRPLKNLARRMAYCGAAS